MDDIPTSQLGSSTDLTDSDILKLKRMYECTRDGKQLNIKILTQNKFNYINMCHVCNSNFHRICQLWQTSSRIL